MKIVIMAGGKGTRISSLHSKVPKPMIKINDKPILEYQIETLKRQGYNDFIIVVGYLKTIIIDYFGNGSRLDVSIKYIEEDVPLGTAGALFYLKNEIKEDFLLINGDIIFNVDINRFVKYHKLKGGSATILTHPNNHPFDSALIESTSEGMVTSWLHKEDFRSWYKNRVNAGLHILSPKIFELYQEIKKMDLDRDVLKPMIKEHKLFCYDSPEYVKDMGTPERYNEVKHDLELRIVESKNLLVQQKAIFLDRDGTINEYVGFLKNIKDFVLLEGVAEAIRFLNKSGYLVIVITNQPVIARGDITEDQLKEIHNKLETLLGKLGAYVDDIFYCPHHPDSGFKGEIANLKIDCNCRKPKPGLLIEASEKYNIDLKQSWMIGDSDSDIEAGLNAGCNVYKITKNKSLLDFIKEMDRENENVK